MPPSSVYCESTKTSPYGKILIDALSPLAEIKQIKGRQNLELRINDVLYCYLVLKGHLGVFRKSDNRMLAVITYPSIMGIAGLVTGKSTIYLKALTPSTVGKVSLEIVQFTIQECNLWEPLSKHMMLLSERLYVSGEQLTAPTAFQIVCKQLMELMGEDISIRGQITAERYIRDKTELSRSKVMDVLSELKRNGSIELNKGILMNINSLP
jgi:CRP-like cAMP-binding protein